MSLYIQRRPAVPSARNIEYHDMQIYTTLTNFSMKYLMMCKVYTNVGGIKRLYYVCLPVCKVIHSLKLVDYLNVQADNPWYNYYLFPIDKLVGHTLYITQYFIMVFWYKLHACGTPCSQWPSQPR